MIAIGRILLPIVVVDNDSAFFAILLFMAFLLIGTVAVWTIALLKAKPLWLKVVSIAGELLIGFYPFWYCFFVAYSMHPWPISAIHGPNTAYAWHGYDRFVDTPTPDLVTNVYYYGAWQGWGEGSAHILRFDCKDPSLFAESLARQPEASLQTILRPNTPAWWPHDDLLLTRIEPRSDRHSGSDDWANQDGRWVAPENCRTYISQGRWYG